ncbi:hypothetical protein DFH06DRAFT_1136067 [Mycena polygramma]|nr:hypothetical protein DFH06DRAFT_1136067 [Mycena polygramma]
MNASIPALDSRSTRANEERDRELRRSPGENFGGSHSDLNNVSNATPSSSETDDSNATDSSASTDTVVFLLDEHGDKHNFDGEGGDPGDGDSPGSDVDKWDDWRSPHHVTRIEVNTKSSDDDPVNLRITSTTQFQTFADEETPSNVSAGVTDWTEQRLRSQAQVHTRLDVQFSPQVILDRSHATLGFEAHRPCAISRSKKYVTFNQTVLRPKPPFSLECGFSEPTQTYKRSNAKTSGNSFTASMGMAGPTPTASAAYTLGNTTTRTVEESDSGPMPAYKITAAPGEGYFEKDGKSYESYDYSYALRPDLERVDLQPPLDVGFAFGINLFDCDEENEVIPPPQVTSVNRNQIWVWVRDDSVESTLRGLIILIAETIPDIRTRLKRSRKESIDVELQSGRILAQSSHGKNIDGGFSLAVIPVVREKYVEVKPMRNTSTLQKFRARARKALRRIHQPAPQVTLIPTEGVSRGWDVTNSKWRNVMYPNLDKHFQPFTTASPDPFLVTYKILPFAV